MSPFGRAWQSLNFYKEDLFGFETLVFATSKNRIYAQLACNTPKRNRMILWDQDMVHFTIYEQQ